MPGILKKLAIVFCIACAPAAYAGGSGTSPQEFLAALFAHYDGKGPGAGIDYASEAEIGRWFTPDLARRIRADQDRAAANDEPPSLDGDPFVGSQEWDVSGVAIAVGKSSDPRASSAVVTFTSMGETHEIRFSLAADGEGWKISDIDWGYDKLSGILGE